MRYGALIRGPVSCRSPRSTLVTTSTSRPPPPFASLIPHSCMARRITSARGTGSPVWAYSSCTMSLRAWRRLARSCWPPTSFASRPRGVALREAAHLLLALGFGGGTLSEYVKRYRATLPIVRNRDLLLVAHP